MNLPALSEKDKKDLEYGVEREVDFVAISFVRREVTLRPFVNSLTKLKESLG